MRARRRLHRTVLKELAVLAVGVGMGGAAAEAVAAVHEEESERASDGLGPDDARDPDHAVSAAAQTVFERLATAPDPSVRGAFLDRVGAALSRVAALDRTRLVAEWATSPNPNLRRAAARALQIPFVALGVDAALELLCEDPDADVRRDAAAACVARRLVT